MRWLAQAAVVRGVQAAQPRQRRGPGDHDDADEEREQPEGLERDAPGGHVHAGAEDDDAQHHPGQRLSRGNGRQRCAQRGGVEGALHEPQPDHAHSYRRVPRPARQQRGEVTGVQHLDRSPGQRIRDPEHQASAYPGQDGPLIS